MVKTPGNRLRPPRYRVPPHLVGLIEQITTNLQAVPAEVSADAGYCSEDNLQALESRKIDAHITTGRQKQGASAPEARPAQPQSRVAAMAAKLSAAGYEGPYRLRKQVVEPVFGQIKQARGSVNSCGVASPRCGANDR